MRVSRSSAPPHVNLHQPLVQPLPDIDLDPFKICIYRRWKVGELIYYALAMLFGTSSLLSFYSAIIPPRRFTFNISMRHPITDFLAFSFIAFTAWRSGMYEYPTMPSLLKTIFRDATRYFILIFSAHILSMLFIFFAPVSGT